MEPRADLPDAPTAASTGGTKSLGDGPRPRPRLDRGVCVGRYVILDWLGEGGMGVVYKAYDPELERAVALKLLNTTGEGDGSSPSSGRRERLLREAKALARLSHPNVLAVFDVGTFGADVFLAAEFADGATMAAWLRESKRTRAEILRVLIAAGEGLAAAHRAGLVHRDFKPANVIVGKDGRVRVLDFGLARSDQNEAMRPLREVLEGTSPSLATSAASNVRVEDKRDGEPESKGATVHLAYPQDVTLPEATPPKQPSSTPPPSIERTSLSSLTSSTSSVSTGSQGLLDMTITHFGQILGTPRFMAPEQHLGRAADARSDQFSFCVSAYEALYGEFPFDGRGDDYAANVTHGRVRNPPPGSDVPRWIRAIVLRGLSVAPSDRFGSMDELLRELGRDPMAARKRWAAGGAVVVLLLGAGIALRHSRPAPEPVCRGAERKLAGVWDDGRKQAVHAAFTLAAGPSAEDPYKRTVAALDDYARGWVAMHTEACEATRVRGDQSAELLDLRVECLSEKLEELRAQVDVFTHADAAMVERAVPAARALPRLEACADAAALRAPIRPPDDPQTRARVEGVRTELAQAKAQQRAGNFNGAMTIATKSAGEATTLGYGPLEAEALYVLGDVQDDLGDYPLSERTLRTSVAAAITGRHESQAARSLIALVAAVGLRQARFREAHDWAVLAQAECERTGDPFIKGELARNDARLYVREAKYPEAHASIEKCLALWEPVLGKEDDFVAGAMTDLGNVLLQEGEDEKALAAYSGSLAILEKTLGPDSPSLAPDLNNQGDIYTGRGEYDEAGKALERARVLWLRALGPDHPKVALALFNLARIDRARGDAAAALAKAERALSIWQAALPAEHPDVALGLHGVAEALRAKGDYAGALAKEESALSIRRKVFGEEDADVAESLVSIGETRLAEGRFAVAAVSLEQALTITDPRDTVTLARTRFDLAQALAGSDPARSRSMAAKALEGYAKVTSPLGSARAAEVEAWLARRGP